MTKILSTYARSAGLQVDPKGPNVKQIFYPLPFSRYITIQTGSAQAAKCYDLWGEVLRLLLPVLTVNHITVVQLGGKEDIGLPGVYDLRGATSILQSHYLISRTLLHAGNDSWLAHCAGSHRKPLVALYGSTDPQPHGPYWFNAAKTRFLVSHRWGGRPVYGPEPVKSVNTIPPEDVANAVLSLLDIQHVFTHQSRYWGQLFSHTILDVIPNMVPSPAFLPEAIINVRMDYHHDENTLASILQTGRRVNIITQRTISNLNLLAAHRGQITSYNHELGASKTGLPSIEYITTIKTLVAQHAFFTKEIDIKRLADLRFQYLDICFVEQTKDTDQSDYLSSALSYLNREDTPDNRLAFASEASYDRGSGAGLWFRSGKTILSNGQAYPSLAHLDAKLSIQAIGDAARVIDNPLFYKDLAHQSIYYQPSYESS